MARRTRTQDLPAMEGPGVARPVFKDVDKAVEAFTSARDKLNAAKEAETEAKLKLIAKMQERDLTVYQFEDEKVTLSTGKWNVKVKHVSAPDSGEEIE